MEAFRGKNAFSGSYCFPPLKDSKTLKTVNSQAITTLFAGRKGFSLQKITFGGGKKPPLKEILFATKKSCFFSAIALQSKEIESFLQHQ